MEAIPWAWVVASIPRRIGLSLASISLHICHDFRRDFRRDFRHDRATIGSRSGVDRGVSASSITVRSIDDDAMAKSPRSRLDRGSIGPRSWSSSTGCRRRQIGILRSHDLHEERRIALHVAIRWMKSGRLDGRDRAIIVDVRWRSCGPRLDEDRTLTTRPPGER